MSTNIGEVKVSVVSNDHGGSTLVMVVPTNDGPWNWTLDLTKQMMIDLDLDIRVELKKKEEKKS